MSLAFASIPTTAAFSVPGCGVIDVLAAPPEPQSQFGYDATDARGKRKTARQYTTSEDYILDASKRSKLTANGRDLAKNFSICAWMVRRHLDYISDFDFHCNSGDMDVDTAVEAFVERWSLRWNCDRAGRHSLPRMIRLAEARRLIDGDVGFLKLASGQLQCIESDRVKQPTGDSAGNGNWVQGVKVDNGGRTLAYAVWNRTRNGLRYDRTVPASRMEWLGYYDRFDQVRGISPLAAALNPLRDVYENLDLKMVQTKIASWFGAIFTTESLDGIGDHTTTSEESEEASAKYDVDFGRGPVKLELDPGDKLEFVESKNPSTEFQAFQELGIQIALKACDIPYSMFAENFTNYSASRIAWIQYQRSCKPKIRDLQELLDNLTFWRLTNAILDGELVLPGRMTIADLNFVWEPKGTPWIDPVKELNGDLLAINAGLDNPQRITKERGRGDFFENVDRIAEAQSYAAEKGVHLSFMPPPNEIIVQEVEA